MPDGLLRLLSYGGGTQSAAPALMSACGQLPGIPPRSACWFCQNQQNQRNGWWAALRRDHPDLFERACRLDEHIRSGGAFNSRGNQPFAGRLFLHESRVPLRQADLRTDSEKLADAGQGQLFDDVALALDCQAGVCFT